MVIQIFNEFESSDYNKRKHKQEERLRLLKNLREAGHFDEEGTEEVTVKATGVNLCDPDPGLIFTGEDLEPELRRPMGVAEAKQCRTCKGFGDLMTSYGGDLGRCPTCGGTGRGDTSPCSACVGWGHNSQGICTVCNGRGLGPTQ